MPESTLQAFLVRVHRSSFEGRKAITQFFAVLTSSPTDALEAVNEREGFDVELSFAGSTLRREHAALLGLRENVPLAL